MPPGTRGSARPSSGSRRRSRVLGLVAIAAGVLTVGALVTIRGAVILREVFRWVAAATAIAVVVTLVIEWVF